MNDLVEGERIQPRRPTLAVDVQRLRPAEPDGDRAGRMHPAQEIALRPKLRAAARRGEGRGGAARQEGGGGEGG